MPTKKLSVFETLSKVDVSNHIDVIKMKKGPALKYVSWAWAWNMLQSKYPDTPTPKYTKFQEMVLQTKREAYKVNNYGKEITRYRTVVLNSSLTDRQVPYLTTPTGTMVECTVTINGRDYTESLYVMDNANNAVINPTVQQINKTQKRCLVKALALAGLGLNLYAGEDLPMGDIAEKDKESAEKKHEAAKAKAEINKVLSEYRVLLPKAAKAFGTTTNEVEKQVKATAEKEIKDYDKLPAIERGARMNGILKKMLEEQGASEQGDIFEEV